MVDGTKQFYANLCPLQDKYLGKRAKHWGITGSVQPLSQETCQQIIDKLAQAETSVNGVRLQHKAVAAATSSETKKTAENPTPWTALQRRRQVERLLEASQGAARGPLHCGEYCKYARRHRRAMKPR